MPSETPQNKAELEMQRLEQWVNELLRTCDRLKAENLRLHHEVRELMNARDELRNERDNLAEKNTIARNRMEAVISRLKSMENSV